jgi:hypothetical protein
MSKCHLDHPQLWVTGSVMAATSQRKRLSRIPLVNLLQKDLATPTEQGYLGPDTPIDKNRWFVCPSTTPLYYAPVYHDLNQKQQLRYNQLTAILFNELISFFETEFASSVCAALAATSDRECDAQLKVCLREFVTDERQHVQWWARLSKRSEPDWYSESRSMIFHVPRVVRGLLSFLTHRPQWFPAVFWIMLALEERSLDISRRCLHMRSSDIEPNYLSAYSDHLKDETRHVHIDWHLIEIYYAKRSRLMRNANARLLISSMAHFFLPPTRSAVRVINRLVSEHNELMPLLPEIKRQLRQLGSDRSYQEMMYSRESTPITFKLFDRFPEMHRIQRFLQTYTPETP